METERKLAVVLNWPYDYVPWFLWASLWDSDVRLEKNVVILRPVSPNPSLSQNMAVKKALELGATEMLFLDVDQEVPAKILEWFRAHDKDIVSALTPLRQYPHTWGIFNLSECGTKKINVKPSEHLQKIDVANGGCLLIRADVFRKVPMPWFATDLTPDGCDVTSSSDFYFFRKCKEHGVEVFVDNSVESPHHTDLVLHSQSLGRKIDYLEVHESVSA